MPSAKCLESQWIVPIFGGLLGLVLASSALLVSHPQLEIDDYRYLYLISRVIADPWHNLAEALVVHNRWDHLWWMPPGSVQYFRPVVFLSFLLGSAFPGSAETAVLLSNVLIYAALCFVAALFFHQLLRNSWAAFLATTLFCSLACHAEVIWYGSGRTDSLLALFYLGALTVHMRQGTSKLEPLFASFLFLLALSSKELAIFFPILALVSDWLSNSRAQSSAKLANILRSKSLYFFGYALVLGAYLMGREIFISGRTFSGTPTDLYFPVRSVSEYLAHAILYIQSGLLSFLTALPTRPYQDLAWDLVGYRPVLLLVCLLILVFLAVWQSTHYSAVLACFLILLTWLPASISYVSDRYFLLPSAGACLLLGSFLRRQYEVKTPARWAAATLLLLLCFHQGRSLVRSIDKTLDLPPSLFREPECYRRALSPLLPTLKSAKRLLVLDLPGHQPGQMFFEQYLRLLTGNPALLATILSTQTGAPSVIDFNNEKNSESGSFTLRSATGVVNSVTAHQDLTPLAAVHKVSRAGLIVEILEARRDSITAARINLPLPLKEYSLVRFEAGGNHDTKSAWAESRQITDPWVCIRGSAKIVPNFEPDRSI